MTEDELKKTIKRHIKLRMYNKTIITQLSMCVVTIKFKEIKKRCEFFVSSQKQPGMLGMPDTAALKIIDINIDSIQAEKEECNANICNARESNTKQEAHVAQKSCINMDAGSKINKVNGHSDNTNPNTITNYFSLITKCRSRQKEEHQADVKNTQYIWGCVSWNWVHQRHIFFAAQAQ